MARQLILTGWQYAAGIELDHDAPRTEPDRTRALVVGAAHLLQLFAQRHRDRSWISAELWIHTIRASSRILDACASPDRPGRWRVPSTQRQAAPDGVIARLRTLARFVLFTSRRL